MNVACWSVAVSLSLGLQVAPAGSSQAQQGPALELVSGAITGGGGSDATGEFTLDGTVGEVVAGAVSAGDYDLSGGILQPAGAVCLLDIDRDGHADAATDVIYIARHLLGLPP